MMMKMMVTILCFSAAFVLIFQVEVHLGRVTSISEQLALLVAEAEKLVPHVQVMCVAECDIMQLRWSGCIVREVWGG
jgi:Na+-transporting NADH:ubiquinone oxidoreductase subunit NqrB